MCLVCIFTSLKILLLFICIVANVSIKKTGPNDAVFVPRGVVGEKDTQFLLGGGGDGGEAVPYKLEPPLLISLHCQVPLRGCPIA